LFFLIDKFGVFVERKGKRQFNLAHGIDEKLIAALYLTVVRVVQFVAEQFRRHDILHDMAFILITARRILVVQMVSQFSK